MAFAYYRSVTTDHTLAGSGDSADYPLYREIDFTALGGHAPVSSSGFDVYFYTDTGLTTRIPAERTSWDNSGKVWKGFVYLANLSASSDVVVYVAYSDSGISTDPNADATFGKTAVWPNYCAVYHFPNGSSFETPTLDSTANANDSTTETAIGASATSPFGMGSVYNGTTSDLVIPPLTGQGTEAFNVELWASPDALSDPSIAWWGNDVAGPCLLFRASGSIMMLGSGSGIITETSSTPTLTNTWQSVVYTAGRQLSTPDGTIYWNGVSQSLSTNLPTQSLTDMNGLQFGNRGGGNQWAGKLAEWRLSYGPQATGVLSQDWVTQNYNNQSDQATFSAVGSEVPVGGGGGGNPWSTYAQMRRQ